MYADGGCMLVVAGWKKVLKFFYYKYVALTADLCMYW